MKNKKARLPLSKSKFNEKSKIVFEFYNEESELVQLFLHQPNVELTDLCLPIFEELYKDFKNGNDLNNIEIVFGKWEAMLRKLKKTYPTIKEDYETWIKHLILNGKFIACEGKFKGQTGALENLLGTSETLRKQFKVLVGFLFALLHFIGAIGLEDKNELRAYYTACNLEDYRESFMIYIEEMEAQSLDLENPED